MHALGFHFLKLFIYLLRIFNTAAENCTFDAWDYLCSIMYTPERFFRPFNVVAHSIKLVCVLICYSQVIASTAANNVIYYSSASTSLCGPCQQSDMQTCALGYSAFQR